MGFYNSSDIITLCKTQWTLEDLSEGFFSIDSKGFYYIHDLVVCVCEKSDSFYLIVFNYTINGPYCIQCLISFFCIYVYLPVQFLMLYHQTKTGTLGSLSQFIR